MGEVIDAPSGANDIRNVALDLATAAATTAIAGLLSWHFYARSRPAPPAVSMARNTPRILINNALAQE